MNSPLELAVGSALFHYTRAEVAFGHILNRGLRFSPLGTMRDPLESQNWTFAWRGRHGVLGVEAVDTPLRMRAQSKRNVKLVSMTCEEPGEQLADPWGWVHRGYARPRLWEQYAENHAGVCLIYDKSLLTFAFEYELTEGVLWRRHGRVSYDRWKQHGRGLDNAIYRYEDPLFLTRSMHEGVLEALAGHLEEHADDLLFTKLPDWSTEHEYRYVLLDEGTEDRFLKVGLVAIVLGHRFPAVALHCAREAAERVGCSLFQMKWGPEPTASWATDDADAAGYVDYLQARLLRL